MKNSKVSKWGLWVCGFVGLFGVLYMLWTMESVLLLFPSSVSCGFREREAGEGKVVFIVHSSFYAAFVFR